MFYKIARFILLYVAIGILGSIRFVLEDGVPHHYWAVVISAPPMYLIEAPIRYIANGLFAGPVTTILCVLFIFLVVMVFYFGYKFIRSGVWRYLAFASILSIPPQYHIVISKIVLGWFHD